MTYLLLILVAVIGLLSTLLATRTGKLKKAEEDLEASSKSYKKLASELKTINEKKDFNPPSTSSERLDRLNKLSEPGKK